MRALLATFISSISVFTSTLSVNAEDVITLKNGDTLTGKVTDSEQRGVYNLIYPESKQTLKIKEEFISSVSFSHLLADSGLNTEKIQLINGDFFPCKLQSFDEQNITITSDYMGTHSIPRKMVKRIFFNNKSKNVIYEGPGEDLTSWKAADKSWKLLDGALTTNSKTQISRTIKNLPENFQLDFTVEWTGTAPRLKVYFCAESTDISKRKDCYFLGMNALDFHIYHYVNRVAKGLGGQSINPKIYTNPKGKVSLYVDRKNKNIVLYYNGKKIKEYKDVATPPKGSGLLFHTLQRTGEGVTLSNIKISNWNGSIIQNNDQNKQRLANNDIITDTDGNPMTGKLLSIVKKGKQFFINFNIAFAKKPSSIPMSGIQVIDLQRGKDIVIPAEATRKLILNQGGLLTYNKSQLVGQKITFTHPIIGEVKVNQDTVSHLEMKDSK